LLGRNLLSQISSRSGRKGRRLLTIPPPFIEDHTSPTRIIPHVSLAQIDPDAIDEKQTLLEIDHKEAIEYICEVFTDEAINALHDVGLASEHEVVRPETVLLIAMLE